MEANDLVELGKATRRAARGLAQLSAEDRARAVEAMAAALETNAASILGANLEDREAAEQEGISSALYSRLKLDESKLKGEIAGVRSVSALPDPVGALQIHRELDDGLVLQRVTVPVGVLGIIFESRPDAVIQIASLAVKSGNGVILKGGRESTRSCQAIVKALRAGLSRTAVDPDAVQLLTTREETLALLELHDYVDLIIPRGSNDFVRFVQQNTSIPVLGHAEGICHLYVDRAADVDRAVALTVDSKVQYPAACNALETLLVHRDIAPRFLPPAAAALEDKGVVLLGDEETRGYIEAAPAGEDDWRTEYLSLTLSIRVVGSLEEAIDHVNTYGSHHTDSIATEDEKAAAEFLARVDSAGVFRNASTRFSDGFRYGFGAEVGISTGKLPPRGPVGLEGLVTYKYVVTGNGHVVADYSGENGRRFTHRDLR